MKKEQTKKETKYLTENKFQVFEGVFEKTMSSVARSFSKIDERFSKIDERFDRTDKVLELILREIQRNSQEANGHRMMMRSLNSADINQERKIEGLETRIEKLEQKVK